MAIKRITQHSDPKDNDILRRANEVVTQETIDSPDFGSLLRDLYDSMIAAEGIGIAAPQIGVNKKVALLHPDITKSSDAEFIRILINPKYKVNDRNFWVQDEGCLSVNKGTTYKPKKRALSVTLTNDVITDKGELITKTFIVQGFRARVIQHEVDHLNGVLYID